METHISIENLIEEAKKKGIDFGKGDPYNRLRYYTKIGWLPHMLRKRDSHGNTRGHYPTWAIERLVEIEALKAAGVPNEEISKKLNVKTKFQSLVGVFTTRETRNQLVVYASFIILVLILANEVGIVRFGKAKSEITTTISTETIDIIDSGIAFVPKNQNKLFVQTPLAKANYKIYVTFTQDYSPANRFWVGEIQDQRGFLVQLDTPVFDNAEFTWWLTN